MTRKNTSIAPRKTWLPLDNEQTAGEKCSCTTTNALQFRSIPMSTNTLHRKRDFGSIGRNTEPHGYCAIKGVGV
jgi:hypothetical protein